MQIDRGKGFFKLLLNAYFTGKSNFLAAVLPQEEYEIVNALPFSSKEPQGLIFDPKEWLARVHYSWFIPVLKKLPQSFQNGLLQALPQKTAVLLQKLQNITKKEEVGITDQLQSASQEEETVPVDFSPQERSIISPAIQYLLLEHFYRHFEDKDICPIPLLSDTPLLPLVSLKKEKLVLIIDLLAVHDVAEEMKHIVDKRTLQQLFSCLTPKQQHYLKHCLHQKSKIQIPRLDLQEIWQSPKKFSTMLHKRGITTFVLALAGQQKDFIWHVCHILDIGRGMMILDLVRKEQEEQTAQVVQQQVLGILQFLTAHVTS